MPIRPQIVISMWQIFLGYVFIEVYDDTENFPDVTFRILKCSFYARKKGNSIFSLKDHFHTYFLFKR